MSSYGIPLPKLKPGIGETPDVRTACNLVRTGVWGLIAHRPHDYISRAVKPQLRQGFDPYGQAC